MTRQSRRLRKAVNHGSPPVSEPCGKRRFRSREIAERALAHIEAVGTTGRVKTEQRAYECDVCMFWHLTSSPVAWPESARKKAS